MNGAWQQFAEGSDLLDGSSMLSRKDGGTNLLGVDAEDDCGSDRLNTLVEARVVRQLAHVVGESTHEPVGVACNVRGSGRASQSRVTLGKADLTTYSATSRLCGGKFKVRVSKTSED